MKKFLTMLVITTMATMMPSASAAEIKTQTLAAGNGIYAFVINCGTQGDDACDDIQTSIPGINCPQQKPDVPSETPDINIPEQDNDTPTQKPDINVPEQDADIPSDTPDVNGPENDNNTPPVDSGLHEYEREVIRLVNEIRVENGLKALTTDAELSRVARIKSQDMKDNNYFSHTSPVYGSPFDMMKNFGISYKTAGENIARGQRTPQQVVDGWMNSSGHRANILNSSYTHIGMGYVADGNYWTQMFVGR